MGHFSAHDTSEIHFNFLFNFLFYENTEQLPSVRNVNVSSAIFDK